MNNTCGAYTIWKRVFCPSHSYGRAPGGGEFALDGAMSSSSPTRPNPSGFPAPSVERLIAQFDNIRLAHRDTGFIGGFMPLHRTQGRSDDDKHPTSVPLCLRPGPRIMCQPASPSPTLPEPQPPRMYPATLAMPMPIPSMPTANVDQSLTMVYAKSAPPDINQYPPPYIRHQHHSSNPSSSPSSPQALSLIQTHTRASSTPPSQTSVTHSAGSGPTVQCNGMTKVGKRCNRVVKAAPLLSLFAPISSEPVERFCFQHVKELLAQSGFYSHKQGGGWVEFSSAGLSSLVRFDLTPLSQNGSRTTSILIHKLLCESKWRSRRARKMSLDISTRRYIQFL